MSLFSLDIRIAASESLPYLIECAKIRGDQYVAEMWQFICPSLLKAIEIEPENTVLPEHMNSLAKVWMLMEYSSRKLKYFLQDVHLGFRCLDV